MEINDAMINDFLLLDIALLRKNEEQLLLDLFEKMKNIEFPSILEQLKTKFTPRKELDIILLQLIGYSTKESNDFLDYLYPALAEEIEKLKTLMEG
jgi:hypothetical protein